MNLSTTLRPTDVEWLALADSDAHAQPKHGRERAACGAPRIDPRFHHPGRPRCPQCLDKVGVVVGARDISRGTPETESEKRAAWGDR